MKLIIANDVEALISFSKEELQDIVFALYDRNYSAGLYYLNTEFNYTLDKMKAYKLLNKEDITYNGKETD